MQLIVGQEEYADRRRRLLKRVAEEDLGAFITFSGLTTFYLTGFHFLPTERPAAAIIPVSGRPILFLPHLEIEHVGATGADAEVITYPEYPGETHPMDLLAALLRDREIHRTGLLAESRGYGSAQGYRGPNLEDLLPEMRIVIEPYRVEEMRMIKSPREIELIRESARWGNLAHALLQEYCAPGRSENEVSMRASAEASQAMMKTLGSAYLPLGKAGANAGFRGQIGANSALPHAVNINAIMREGDNLVTGAGSGVGGYGSELERTMFLGEPCREQRRYFGYMMEMQDAAFAAIEPGRTCSVVDDAVMAIFRERDLETHWRHHTGHALGLLGHEAPFFDVGDDTVMQVGMVFSVEPGIYVPGLGGFRHSDTVVVTDTGIEFLTYYPRDLESLIIHTQIRIRRAASRWATRRLPQAVPQGCPPGPHWAHPGSNFGSSLRRLICVHHLVLGCRCEWTAPRKTREYRLDRWYHGFENPVLRHDRIRRSRTTGSLLPDKAGGEHPIAQRRIPPRSPQGLP